MKAIVLRHPASLDHLEVVDLPDPGEPGPGEIRVRLRASSLNFHDLAVVNGLLPAADRRIPMSDGAGVVEAVGAGVSEFAVGDDVVSHFFPGWLDGEPTMADFATTPGDGVDGYAAECVVRPAFWFTPVPKGYTHAEAATLTTAGLTAWRALVDNGRIKAGDTLLVQGTGGVSMFALQFAKAMGATVIATSSSDEKLERVRALGADHLINYRREPDWAARVLEITGGRGVDHVMEVGGPETLGQSFEAARIGGHIAFVGILTGLAGPVPTARFMLRQQRVQGLLVGSRRQQLEMVRGIEAIGLKPVIDRSFPLEGLADAFRFQQAGGHFGKICVEIGG
jgi:NADPH:quinone reductase-like Zn-dependent oxidoreductase